MEYFTSSSLSIWTLLKDYWPFFNTEHWIHGSNRIREHVTKSIDQIMKCKTWELWYMKLKCNNCCETKQINFTCHKSACSRCSKPLCDKWINNMRSWLPTHIEYIHITRTLPQELRELWLSFRSHRALNILFKKAQKIILHFFESRFGCTPWVFSILHTFGSYINRNPHLHMVVTVWWLSEKNEWVDCKKSYLSYTAIKSQWRALVIQECRFLLNKYQAHRKTYRKPIFEKTFEKKSWYIKMSDPIIDVHSVMWYLTRYMYRAPLAIANIKKTNLIPWDINNSTLTIQYKHKKPVEVRTITYTMKAFLGLLAQHIPDKYFRIVRYAWLFSHRKRKKSIQRIQELIPIPHNHLTLQERPLTYRQRLITIFQKDPYICHCCWDVMIPHSITFFASRQQRFITRIITDTS